MITRVSCDVCDREAFLTRGREPSDREWFRERDATHAIPVRWIRAGDGVLPRGWRERGGRHACAELTCQIKLESAAPAAAKEG